jgi:hypothetical protein
MFNVAHETSEREKENDREGLVEVEHETYEKKNIIMKIHVDTSKEEENKAATLFIMIVMMIQKQHQQKRLVAIATTLQE